MRFISPILLLLALSAAFRRAQPCTLTTKYSVFIISSLPPNTPKLSTKCWSKDDDLGTHALAPGQNFNFTFCESAWGSTKFNCHVWWNGKDKTFAAYDSGWNKEPCDKTGHCYWFAQADGIYFSNRYPPWRLEKVYPW